MATCGEFLSVDYSITLTLATCGEFLSVDYSITLTLATCGEFLSVDYSITLTLATCGEFLSVDYSITLTLTTCGEFLSVNYSVSFAASPLWGKAWCCVHYLSKPNTLGTKRKLWFREVSRLERFYMYSKYIEQDLKTTSSLETVQISEGLV